MGHGYIKLIDWIKAAVYSLEQNRIKPFKTSVLKILYLTLPEEFRWTLYEPYLYGPYSRTISDLLDVLAFGYKSLGAYIHTMPNGTWTTIFSFKGSQVELNKVVFDKINALVKKLKQKGIKTAKELSLLCKVYYLKERYETENINHLSQKSRIIGWNLSGQQIAHYLEVLSDIP